MDGVSQPSPALPRPGLLGRAIRIGAGAVLLYEFGSLLAQARPFLRPLPGWHVPVGGWWVIALLCWLVLPDSLVDSFRPRLGTRAQYIFVVLAVAAVVWSRASYGYLWAPPLALLILLLLLTVFFYGGVSFLLAGAIAAPG